MGSVLSSDAYDPKNHGQSSRELYDSYVQDPDKFMDLSDKIVAITGTSSHSIGFYIAEIAIRKQAKRLLLCNRDSTSSNKGYEELLEVAKDCSSTTKIEKVVCDLQDLESVKAAGQKLNDMVKGDNGLDILVCNAGVMALKDTRTKDGFDVQMQTNQLSHFVLIQTVWPSIVQAAKTRKGARVVTHSSSARYTPPTNLAHQYFTKCDPGTLGGDSFWKVSMLQVTGLVGGHFERYHQTKLANGCFAMCLHDKLQASSDPTLKSIQSSSADPGLATSNLQATTMKDGGMPSFLAKLFAKGAQSPADGSLPISMAAFGKETKSGSFFMPEKQANGPPYASIVEGKPTKEGDEKLTLSKDNKENVWSWCEEALGTEFKIE